jgi:cell wall-associated NlpC family hydrolase
MTQLEKRLNAFRPDLADARLQGQVEAARFAEGHLAQLAVPIASLHRAPAPDAMQETQVLMGEMLRVFDVNSGWAWVQLQRDHYVGYIRNESLRSDIHVPTHYVAVPSTLLYPKADLKTLPVQFLPLNAQVTVTAQHGNYMALATGGFVFAAHVAVLTDVQKDFVAVASQFIGAPYLWGGKSVHGLDCSGLVQTSLEACGKNAPRDADLQELGLGRPLLLNDLDGLRRGDLVFWPGHVGIMTDSKTLIHANGHQMQVTIESLTFAEAHIAKTGKQISSLKRL